jgi:hypothetical protein
LYLDRTTNNPISVFLSILCAPHFPAISRPYHCLMLTLLYRSLSLAVSMCATTLGRLDPLDCFNLLRARHYVASPTTSLGFSLTTGLNGWDPYRCFDPVPIFVMLSNLFLCWSRPCHGSIVVFVRILLTPCSLILHSLVSQLDWCFVSQKALPEQLLKIVACMSPIPRLELSNKLLPPFGSGNPAQRFMPLLNPGILEAQTSPGSR